MDIVVAILAKDKAHCLPFYLECIYNQTFPKQNIHLYIRTNDNSDNTAIVLKEFVNKYGNEYKSIFFDDSDIDSSLKKYKPHEWTPPRFKILGEIRQASIDYAKNLCAHYFVADCDNFIVPSVLETLFVNRELGIIAPMLMSESNYSNFHYDVNKIGYLRSNALYFDLLNRRIQGISIVKVIHCTYFINTKLLDIVCYKDSSERHEYVIFSETLRNNNIDQYLDNRRFYGFLVFSDTEKDLNDLIKSKWKQTIATEFKTNAS